MRPRTKGVKKYKDIVKDYGDYKKFQVEKYSSHEILYPRWEEGQKRYIERSFSIVPKDTKILDAACGDGVGLRHFKSLDYTNVVGVELNEDKLATASASGYQVIGRDMHDLSCFGDHSFDVVYSSHSLEHAYRPSKVLSEFHRVLAPGGFLFVVLPYPDLGSWNDEAHGAKYELGTNVEDNGATVIRYFEKCGFTYLTSTFDDFREPEIWLYFFRQ